VVGGWYGRMDGWNWVASTGDMVWMGGWEVGTDLLLYLF
jgi:hypothetical protein